MTFRDGVIVEASEHAVEKALIRVPVVRGADAAAAKRWIERAAARGLIAKRSAQSVPRWAARGKKRSRVGIQGTARFVWNEEETAVFLCRRTRMYRMRRGAREDLGLGWLVVTVIGRPDAAVA